MPTVHPADELGRSCGINSDSRSKAAERVLIRDDVAPTLVSTPAASSTVSPRGTAVTFVASESLYATGSPTASFTLQGSYPASYTVPMTATVDAANPDGTLPRIAAAFPAPVAENATFQLTGTFSGYVDRAGNPLRQRGLTRKVPIAPSLER